MQHGLLVIEDDDAVIIDSKTDLCCVLTHSLSDSVFLQLSALAVRGIALQHGLLVIEDDDAVIIDSKTDLCCVLIHSLSDSVFLQLSALAVRGIALQHGLLVIEDDDAVINSSEANSQVSVDPCLYHNPCCILTCSHSCGVLLKACSTDCLVD